MRAQGPDVGTFRAPAQDRLRPENGRLRFRAIPTGRPLSAAGVRQKPRQVCSLKPSGGFGERRTLVGWLQPYRRFSLDPSVLEEDADPSTSSDEVIE